MDQPIGVRPLHHDGFQDGQWGDRGGHPVDEVDAVFFSLDPLMNCVGFGVLN